jgi:hypothetical protein
MPYADPERAAAYNRERWRTHGAAYRAARPAALPPLSRQQVLDEDIRQEQALAALEGRRVGRRRAAERFEDWLAAERRWIRVSSTPFTIGGLDAQSD